MFVFEKDVKALAKEAKRCSTHWPQRLIMSFGGRKYKSPVATNHLPTHPEEKWPIAVEEATKASGSRKDESHQENQIKQKQKKKKKRTSKRKSLSKSTQNVN